MALLALVAKRISVSTRGCLKQQRTLFWSGLFQGFTRTTRIKFGPTAGAVTFSTNLSSSMSLFVLSNNCLCMLCCLLINGFFVLKALPYSEPSNGDDDRDQAKRTNTLLHKHLANILLLLNWCNSPNADNCYILAAATFEATISLSKIIHNEDQSTSTGRGSRHCQSLEVQNNSLPRPGVSPHCSWPILEERLTAFKGLQEIRHQQGLHSQD